MNKIKSIFDRLYYERKKIIIISILTILLISIFLFYKSENNKEIEGKDIVKEEQKEPVKEEVKEKKVMVDIKGEVNSPGCYEVSEDLRVKDVIDLAGGLTKEADTSSINLSSKIKDEMVIVIDKKGEVNKRVESDVSVNTKPTTSKQTVTVATKPTGKISINKGTIKELTTLTGIGESKARKIIEYREKNGPFSKIEDIKKVSGIGESIFAKIKDDITL
jgi:competence protein ComEA